VVASAAIGPGTASDRAAPLGRFKPGTRKLYVIDGARATTHPLPPADAAPSDVNLKFTGLTQNMGRL
jgi:hypothetical protein